MADDGINIERSSSSSISENVVHNCGRIAMSLYGQSNATVKGNTLLSSIYGLYSVEATSLVIR